MSARRRGMLGVAGVLGAALVVWAVMPGTAGSATTIPAGFDLFETNPQTTRVALTGLQSSCFGQNMDPLQGSANLGGVPLKTFKPTPTSSAISVGDADTVVRRPGPAMPNPDATVPIEIVALNLVSVQPIRVTFNHGASSSLWKLNVTAPAPQQQGQITIHDPDANPGGTFDSQLPVTPRLTFTRLSDGQKCYLNPGTLSLQSSGTPWHQGCVLPALRVSGLNDGFCPGLSNDPQPRKVQTTETSLLAQHGVYPAQPALQHFECYTVEPKPFQARQVSVHDQFYLGPENVTSRAELCNPAQKNAEPFTNGNAHLQCYAAGGVTDRNARVAVQNQLGTQLLRVHTPRRLCLPTKKRLISQPFKAFNPLTIDHFNCYGVTKDSPLRAVNPVPSVNLKDEFGTQNVSIGQPYQLCAPVDKNGSQVRHPVKHLVCYGITANPVQRDVEIQNQFETIRLRTRVPVGLCVPSNKFVR